MEVYMWQTPSDEQDPNVLTWEQARAMGLDPAPEADLHPDNQAD